MDGRILMRITEKAEGFHRVLEHEICHAVTMENLTPKELESFRMGFGSTKAVSVVYERLAEKAVQFIHSSSSIGESGAERRLIRALFLRAGKRSGIA